MVVEMHRECGQEADLTVLTGSAKEAIYQLLNRVKYVHETAEAGGLKELGRLAALEIDSLVTMTGQCPFEGMVEVSALGPAPVLLSWTCPTCGHEHEEGPD